ncbi:hypothetical protein CEXT_675051 [Caerostris extrusa]|uniref:Uncharacterized protein n=1 Tax=Caerostris extrusa TaxID=172846 RepID=A0AAV4S504_CAEEX|nr:hypothetical protein CEXT_675051 [Caerostris extrusa]
MGPSPPEVCASMHHRQIMSHLPTPPLPKRGMRLGRGRLLPGRGSQLHTVKEGWVFLNKTIFFSRPFSRRINIFSAHEDFNNLTPHHKSEGQCACSPLTYPH